MEIREFGVILYCAGQRLFWCSSETSRELLKGTLPVSHLGEGVQFRSTLCGTHCGQSDTWTGLSSSYSVFPYQLHSIICRY